MQVLQLLGEPHSPCAEKQHMTTLPIMRLQYLLPNDATSVRFQVSIRYYWHDMAFETPENDDACLALAAVCT